MRTFAHIVHPGVVDPSSDLITAQPITFRTMEVARAFAEGVAHVTLYAVQYCDEERIPLPESFVRVPDLTRSIADIKTFRERRKLALIRHILTRLQESAPDADYLIYTNVDLGLQPYFYVTVDKFASQGYDAFVINRRTITDQYTSVAEIPLMYAQAGEAHKGYDCFVFRSGYCPRFELGNVCIGTAWFGRAMLANMAACATRFTEFREEHATFHMGDSQVWREKRFDDYFAENRKEYQAIFEQIETERGKFAPDWRSYLLDTGKKRRFPDYESARFLADD